MSEPRSPVKAAVKWGLLGLLAGFVVAMAVSFATVDDTHDPDAYEKAGEKSAPFVLACAGVAAVIGYQRAKPK